MHPDGVEVTTSDTTEALAQTSELLRRDEVVIFEAAIEWNSCLVRVDALVKTGNTLRFYEVKAKSYYSRGASPFIGKRGGLLSGWKDYLYDVAFQHYVISQAIPDVEIIPFLRLVDSAAMSSIDGINQKFRIATFNGRRQVAVDPEIPLTRDGDGLLVDIPVSNEVNQVQTKETLHGMLFTDFIASLLLHKKNDQRITPNPGSQCKSCEYRPPSFSTSEPSGFGLTKILTSRIFWSYGTIKI